jgi:hypothetical protein
LRLDGDLCNCTLAILVVSFEKLANSTQKRVGLSTIRFFLLQVRNLE